LAVETYFVPHSETQTLPRFLVSRPTHVSVRGSWHPEVMKAMRVFLDYGLTAEEPESVDAAVLSPRSLLRAHLLHRQPVPDGPVAFFLRIDVTGRRGHSPRAVSYRSEHPTTGDPAGTA
jgi:saccharopine dehydrogenase-like NADP-dependent oxidoreductase